MKLKYRFVFFDVDSTLVTIEGIDVLSRGDERIAAITRAAMNGEIPLEQAYTQRLDAIRPSRADVEQLGALYTRSLVTGAEETLDTLRRAGAQIHLVTAGIAQAIGPLAAHLGVPPRSVHAVELQFDEAGRYTGFDHYSPLTRQRGKELVVLDVRARSHGRAAFVGDGASDLEAQPAVDLFIGFGGVAIREKVKANAAVFVSDSDLRSILPHLGEEAS